MRALWGAAIAVISLSLPCAGAPAGSPPGFTPPGGARERLLESQFIDMPTTAGASESLAALAGRPHYAGTPADRDSAYWMRDRLRGFGIAADVEPFSADVDTPRELVLELAPPADLGAEPRTGKHHGRRRPFPVPLTLTETADPADPATAARSIGLPFIAGCADGDVSAPLVFAGRGTDADYATLGAAGIDVRGSVVLIRGGTLPLGAVADRAQAHAASGILIYADPQDSSQLPGSVARGWAGPAARLPMLPIAASNARILLAALSGPPGPAGWSGGLPVAYPLARGPGRVHLIVKLNRKRTTLWNTIGTIPGLRSDERVIAGAARDAWVYGAGDNGSGVTTLLEIARGLGFLGRGGWHPARTIVLAGWDGGTLGEAGERAYAAAHWPELEWGAIAYLAADRTATGPDFGAAADPALAPLVGAAAQLVPDPGAPGAALWQRWAQQSGARVALPSASATAALGGTHVPQLSAYFRGSGGVGGTAGDTLRYAAGQTDPGAALQRAAAQVDGLIALRLADAPGTPFAFSGYVAAIRPIVDGQAAAARRAGLPFDRRPLNRGLAALRAGAARFERPSAVNRPDSDGRALAAVRGLDALIDGESTSTASLAAITVAVTAHDPRALAMAVRATGIQLQSLAATVGGARL